MNLKHLATYLNDHLAGSVTLIELLEHIRSSYPGVEAGRLAEWLNTEVTEDRRDLERLMQTLGVSQSVPRKASAWMAEKLAQLKLRLDDKSGGPLHLLEAMEAASLGIEGKRCLWISLSMLREHVAAVRDLDLDRLIRRAEAQRDRVESLRRQSAIAALADAET
jgi:hypothetical protein